MSTRLRELRLRTPEGAEFSFTLASPLLRLLAVSIDFAAIITAWSTISVLISMLHVFSSDWAGLAMVLGYFVFNTSYDILMEWLWRGQSLGKRVVGLRVVDAQGLQLTLPQIILRNLLRYIDLLPGAYLVGGLTSLINDKAQRLGDLAAGTLVIWDAPVAQPDLSSFSEAKYNSLRKQAHIVARLRQAITPREAQSAWLALKRRDQLEPAARVRLFAEIAGHFRSITRLPDEAVEGVSDEQLVRNVVEVLYRK